VDLADDDADSATASQFKRDLCSALKDRFALDKLQTAKHPFMTATVLGPATKACDMRAAAYEHVRCLTQEIDTTSPSTSQLLMIFLVKMTPRSRCLLANARSWTPGQRR